VLIAIAIRYLLGVARVATAFTVATTDPGFMFDGEQR
jgi:hypothetical protein